MNEAANIEIAEGAVGPREVVSMPMRQLGGALTPVTPMAMLSHAVASGAGLETITKLMDLQDRYEARQARMAFDEAVANAKAEIPVIAKNREGHNNKRY